MTFPLNNLYNKMMPYSILQSSKGWAFKHAFTTFSWVDLCYEMYQLILCKPMWYFWSLTPPILFGLSLLWRFHAGCNSDAFFYQKLVLHNCGVFEDFPGVPKTLQSKLNQMREKRLKGKIFYSSLKQEFLFPNSHHTSFSPSMQLPSIIV